MDAVFFWPRLWIGLSKETREDLDSSQAVADSALYSSCALAVAAALWGSFGAAAAVGYSVIDTVGSLGCLGFALVAVAGSTLCYRAAIPVNAQFGELFKAARCAGLPFQRHNAGRMSRPVRQVSPSPFNRWGQFSPDGRWVAFQSNATGRYEIDVRPFEARRTCSRLHRRRCLSKMVRDGRELVFVAPDARMMAARIHATATTLHADLPGPLFASQKLGGGQNVIAHGHQYDVARGRKVPHQHGR